MDGIILKCNTSIQTNRSSAAIYNILKGTKAIQTVLDVHLYQLENMYGIYPSLQKQDFDRHIEQLIYSRHIHPVDENRIKMTSQGEELLQKCEKTGVLNYFDGIKYIGVSGPFLERLLLTIQTFTNKQVNNNQFIPVVDKPEIAKWVRQYYHIHKKEITWILTKLYKELSHLLAGVTENEANLFVDRLSGHNHYGKSIYQLHKKYDHNVYDVPLILVGITQKFLTEITQKDAVYPLLKEFIADLHRSTFLTDSAKRTYKLYQRDFQAYEIASIRNLKINTIYDHLVEIALYDGNFPYQSYVNQMETKIILEAIQQTNSFKLKDIKALINTDITYFQIRLVLAAMRNNH